MKYKYLVVVHEEWYPSTFLFEDESSAETFYQQLKRDDDNLLVTISQVQLSSREVKDSDLCITHCGKYPDDIKLETPKIGSFMEDIKNA